MKIKTVSKEDIMGRLFELLQDKPIGELIQLIETITEEEE